MTAEAPAKRQPLDAATRARYEAELEELLRMEYAALCRRNFWEYCKSYNPDFYREERLYLKDLCTRLQLLYEGKLKNDFGEPIKWLIVNMPPRHGKTQTIECFCRWILGQDLAEQVLTVSYNSDLSGEIAKNVRNGISSVKADPYAFVYSDIFPKTKLQPGDAAMGKWRVMGAPVPSFLATSPGSTLTGFGGNGLIDDLVKNAEEAANERVLDGHLNFYDNTFKSRITGRGRTGKQRFRLVVATRWATGDLTGKLLRREPKKWDLVCYPAYDEKTGKMLCDDILSLEDYRDLEATLDPVIFMSNYQQVPFDRSGSLYTVFKTYNLDALPKEGVRKNYTDVADEGSDFVCSIDYLQVGTLYYVLDVLYSREAAPKTTPLQAMMMAKDKITWTDIESNNGGTGYGREVERVIRDKPFMGTAVWAHTHFNLFHQAGNKWSRITSNAVAVMNCIVMPADWRTRWPLFHADVMAVKHGTQPKNDDGPDALTGIIEKNLTSGPLAMSETTRSALAARRNRSR